MRGIGRALVLAGGKGTRMAATHGALQKPLVPLLGVPLLLMTLRKLSAAGIPEIVVALHHGAESIRRAIGRWTLDPPALVRTLVEPEPLGTIGAAGLVAGGAGTLLVTNADLANGIDLGPFLDRHRSTGSDLTIAVHTERHRLTLGEVLIDGEGAVRGYAEKPEKTFQISSGTYLLEPSVLRLIRAGENLSIPDLVRRTLDAGLMVGAHAHSDPWCDVNDAAGLASAGPIVAADPARFGAWPLQETGTADRAAGDLWLGLDIGGTKVLAVVADSSGRILASAQVPSVRDDGPEAVFERAVALARGLIAEHPGTRGAGAGFAGLVDARSGVVMSSIMLPGWDGFPLATRLASALDVPASADNDATAAGLGEYVALGEPPGMHLVVLTVGTGIGGAILVDGHIYRGAAGTAGEFGNMSLDWNGPRCWCGSAGCLNMLASGTAIVEAARSVARAPDERRLFPAGDTWTVEDVARASAGGSTAARDALERAIACLGAGLANIVNILSPHRIAICGGVARLGDSWLEAVRRETGRRAFAEPMRCVEIGFARLGCQTGAFGAAELARRRIPVRAAGESG